VSVGVVDLAGLAHEVLEVLPRGGRGEVLHHHAVASPGARGPPAAETPVPVSKVAPAATTSAAPRELNADSSSIEVFAVQVLYNILSITPVIKLGKPKSFLNRNVPYSSIALEEFLNVPAATMICPERVPCPN